MSETAPRTGGRVLLAFFLQPLVVAALVFVLFPLIDYSGRPLHGGTPIDPMDAAVAVAFGAGFASIFVVAFVAVPVYMWLARRGRVTLRQSLIAGAILGNLPGMLIVVAAALTGAGAEPGLSGLTYGLLGALRAIAIGAIVGTGAAAAFWWMSGLRRSALVALVIAVTMTGCGGAARSATSVARPLAHPSLAQLDAIYIDSIRRSAVVSPGDARPLVPLLPGPDGTVTVTTWAFCRGAGAVGRCGSYVPGPIRLEWDAWVVSDQEFRSACRKLGDANGLRISQMLGLPAPRTPLAADTLERQLVTFAAVPVASVFRPCTDPRTDTDRCSTSLPPTLPANAPPDFYRWFVNQAMSAWRAPADGQPPDGYPWTRLGYTYDWAPHALTPYGVSEYVIPGSLRPVEVNVVSVKTARDYCGG